MIWTAAEDTLRWHWRRLIITATVNITQYTFCWLSCLSFVWLLFSFRHTETATGGWFSRRDGATCVAACRRHADVTDGVASTPSGRPLTSPSWRGVRGRLCRCLVMTLVAAGWARAMDDTRRRLLFTRTQTPWRTLSKNMTFHQPYLLTLHIHHTSCTAWWAKNTGLFSNVCKDDMVAQQVRHQTCIMGSTARQTLCSNLSTHLCVYHHTV